MRNTNIVTDEKKIDDLLTRGVENIFPNKDFLKARLMKGERMRFYYGIDPTGPTIHLGHLVPIRKLAELQKLGHEVIFLIGDFTAMIGDPTDKTATRKKLTRDEVLKNCKNYKEQVSKIISFSGSNKAILKFNSEWHSKLSFEEIIELESHFTADQILKRDMFVKRQEENKPVYFHELMYPIMQGYDSIAMDVDGELGGNDQTFNMLAGRDLMKTLKNKEKFVIATKLLVDPSGKKMGKTEGNMVSLDQTPEDMFGKVMSWADNMIIPGFEIVTNIPLFEIDQVKAEMERGSNPKDYKIKLALEIVTMIHGAEAAEKAQKAFENIFKKGEVPDDVKEVSVEKGTLLIDIVIKEVLVASKGEFRRLIEGNAVGEVGNENIITDPNYKIEKDIDLRIGKKRFVKIRIK